MIYIKLHEIVITQKNAVRFCLEKILRNELCSSIRSDKYQGIPK